MIPVNRPSADQILSKATIIDLGRRSKTASKYVAREKKIQNAWKRFSGTPAREDVEHALDKVFSGKCCYCEIIVPHDIEHFYPKSTYPRQMFDWHNFLRACKNCNGFKNDSFPTKRTAPVFLDPCSDDPADFFSWDLDTGLPIVNLNPARRTRALKTIETFDLRNQAFCEERRVRARNLIFLMLQSVEQTPSPQDACQWLLEELDTLRPWRSVARQIVRDPQRRNLIARVKAAVPASVPLFAELAV